MVRIENRKFVARAGVRYEHPVDSTLVANQIHTVTTNGTTAVNVFGANGAPHRLTVTGVYAIAKDTTAGAITLSGGGTTVANFPKSATSGVVIGATTLANTTIAPGATVTVVSSTAGNGQCFITYSTV